MARRRGSGNPTASPKTRPRTNEIPRKRCPPKTVSAGQERDAALGKHVVPLRTRPAPAAWYWRPTMSTQATIVDQQQTYPPSTVVTDRPTNDLFDFVAACEELRRRALDAHKAQVDHACLTLGRQLASEGRQVSKAALWEAARWQVVYEFRHSADQELRGVRGLISLRRVRQLNAELAELDRQLAQVQAEIRHQQALLDAIHAADTNRQTWLAKHQAMLHKGAAAVIVLTRRFLALANPPDCPRPILAVDLDHPMGHDPLAPPIANGGMSPAPASEDTRVVLAAAVRVPASPAQPQRQG